jgi:uncharacterized protein YecE (DUF72 family)
VRIYIILKMGDDHAAEKELELFFSSMAYLEDKILVLLIQLPPSMGIVEGMNGLTNSIPELDKRFRYAVEVS